MMTAQELPIQQADDEVLSLSLEQLEMIAGGECVVNNI